MATPGQSLLLSYLFDAEKILRRRLNSLPNVIRHGDAEAAEDARDEAAEIAKWLPVEGEAGTPEEQIEAFLFDPSLTELQRRNELRRIQSARKAPRGRPRSPDALRSANRALFLRFGIGLSWRKIAEELGECSHTRPVAARNCVCGERVRKNAERLQYVLGLADYDVRGLQDLRGPYSESLIWDYLGMLPPTAKKNPYKKS